MFRESEVMIYRFEVIDLNLNFVRIDSAFIMILQQIEKTGKGVVRIKPLMIRPSSVQLPVFGHVVNIAVPKPQGDQNISCE